MSSQFIDWMLRSNAVERVLESSKDDRENLVKQVLAEAFAAGQKSMINDIIIFQENSERNKKREELERYSSGRSNVHTLSS